MSLLTPEELEKLSGAEELFPSPIPVQCGGNNARLYGYSPKMQAALQNDKVAYYKEIYEKHGGDRSNLAYGYINKA